MIYFLDFFKAFKLECNKENNKINTKMTDPSITVANNLQMILVSKYCAW